MRARLHPKWTMSGYRYAVLFGGRLLVENSRDPELDVARALAAMGLTGKLTICDGKSGLPRTVIDIEKAARLTTKEGPLRFVACDESRPGRAPTAETGLAGAVMPEASEEAA